MYSSFPGLILGFQGCDEKVGRAIISGKQILKPSKNTYDWLGHGFYFWEFNPARALSFAQERAKRPLGASRISKPFALGAVIDLGHCLNLLDETGIEILRKGFEALVAGLEEAGTPLPANVPSAHPLKRDLDCAVIEFIHKVNEKEGNWQFDSVRGVFIEGQPVFPGAGVHEKNHIQICVRNPNCIKGFFEPRTLDPAFSPPHEGDF